MSLSSRNSYTDVIFQSISVFIEGVEVPFISGSVSQQDGALPSASISVPPAPGLMDIGKYYQPKVHIFYRDLIDDKEKDRLIFEGYITGVSYSKSVEAKSESIQFNCTHKYGLLQEFLIDYTGFLSPASLNNSGAGIKVTQFNSQSMVIEAMTGIAQHNPVTELTADNPSGDVKVLPASLKDFYDRLKGVPGMMVNYWQQLKRDSLNPELKPYQDAYVYLYRPLIEDGLEFFRRVTGHQLIETMIENGRVDYSCNVGDVKNVVIPPANKLFLTNAVQVEMAYGTIQNYLQSSGEVTNIYQIFNQLFSSMDYGMITLGSPIESTGLTDKTQTYAADTVIAPRLPFYYSPTCNIILPRMYTSIRMTSDDDAVPTRVEFINRESPDGSSGDITNTYFRGPASLRDAIAGSLKGNLQNTMGPHNGKYDIYEQGRGIKLERGDLPRWLSFLSHSNYNQENSGGWPDKEKDKENWEAISSMAEAWTARYGADKESMNPWSEKAAGIMPHHRMLFAAVDYYYTQSVARTRSGSIQCPFNPYIIPGYPMDIMGSSPNDPSFHALCISTTHSFTSRSITTDVSFTSAMTYSELVNYYVPFVHPWLQVQLGLTKKPTIVNNPDGVRKAHEFYHGTLGKDVWAISPEMLYDFSTGMTNPLHRLKGGQVSPGGSGETVKAPNGGEMNPNLSYQGNLSFAYREIESLDSIELREGIKFIRLTQANYNHTTFEYQDKILEKESDKLNLGQSLFLDYAPPVNTVTPTAAATTPATPA